MGSSPVWLLFLGAAQVSAAVVYQAKPLQAGAVGAATTAVGAGGAFTTRVANSGYFPSPSANAYDYCFRTGSSTNYFTITWDTALALPAGSTITVYWCSGSTNNRTSRYKLNGSGSPGTDLGRDNTNVLTSSVINIDAATDLTYLAIGGSGSSGIIFYDVVIETPAPSCTAINTSFNVTTSTETVCAGVAGATIGLSGSETGVSYQLYNDGTAVGSPVEGRDSAISFGSYGVGTYTVVATGSDPFCTTPVDMTGSVVVSEEPCGTTYDLTININPFGAGFASGAGTYAEDAVVPVSATANRGYVFDSWSPSGVVVSDEVTMEDDITITANFIAATARTIQANAGTGITSADVNNAAGAGYYDGETAVFTASVTSGYTWDGWYNGGSRVSGDNPYSPTVSGDITLEARAIKDITVPETSVEDECATQATLIWDAVEGADRYEVEVEKVIDGGGSGAPTLAVSFAAAGNTPGSTLASNPTYTLTVTQRGMSGGNHNAFGNYIALDNSNSNGSLSGDDLLLIDSATDITSISVKVGSNSSTLGYPLFRFSTNNHTINNGSFAENNGCNQPGGGTRDNGGSVYVVNCPPGTKSVMITRGSSGSACSTTNTQTIWLNNIEIYVAGGSSSSYTPIDNSPFTVNAPETSLALTDLDPESDYRYKITAVRDAGGGVDEASTDWETFSTDDISCSAAPILALVKVKHSSGTPNASNLIRIEQVTLNEDGCAEIYFELNAPHAKENFQVYLEGDGVEEIELDIHTDDWGDACAYVCFTDGTNLENWTGTITVHAVSSGSDPSPVRRGIGNGNPAIETYSLEIGDGTTTGLGNSTVGKELKSKDCFTVTGVKVDCDAPGIIIKKKTFTDGSTEVVKELK